MQLQVKLCRRSFPFQDLIGRYTDNISLHESFNEAKKIAETFINNQKNKFTSVNFDETERDMGEREQN